MESSRVDELLSKAIDEQVAEYRAWRDALEALTERVTRLEAAVDGLRAEVAASVEDGVRAGMAGQLEQLAGDLRRQISDLGRLIVNDLGQLPKLLGDRPATAGPPATPPAEVDLRDPAPRGEEPATGEPAVDPLDLPYAAEPAGPRRSRFRRR